MAPDEPSREELLDENERLRAENERLKAMLQQQDNRRKAEEDSALEEGRARKKQRTQLDENQLVPFEHNAGMTDVERGSHREQAPEDQQQVIVATPRISIIRILPAELLGRVLDFLPFSERRAFFMCGSRELWKTHRVEYETKRMCDLILDYIPTNSFLCRDFLSVCSLNFGPHCSDTTLALLCHERAFPQLKHLAMVGSVSVTDNGLRLLTENSNRRQKLETLNIAFCPRTTIEVTFLLRVHFINLRVVRRQPEWMDGVARSPDGSRTVYWADGSSAHYESNGEMYNCSYFRDLFEEGSRLRVVCKKQVVFCRVFEPDQGSRSELLGHICRLGVTFLYRSNTHSMMRTEPVLSAGTFPVQGFPRPEDAHLIPVGTTRVFNRQGGLCQRNDPNKYAQVWHLQLQPLNALMPPQDAVDRIRNYVEREKVVLAGRNQEQDERNAHVQLGGNRNDVPPEYWFQFA